MRFIYYDLMFLIIFCLIIIFFLYRNKKKIKRESIFLLYKTKIGLKFINWFSKKFSNILKVFSYISVSLGYLFMILVIVLLFETFKIISTIIYVPKIPPIMPLIPYLPQIFKTTLLPPFYFTYWIIIIIVVATVHEFGHGIFARFFKIKIKSTGFGFLGPFLLAFVEEDKRGLEKKQKFKQLAVMSAGPFANILTGVIFLIILQSFFLATYIPSGVMFNGYYISEIPLGNITSINNFTLDKPTISEISRVVNLTGLKKNETLKISVNGKSYFSSVLEIEEQIKFLNSKRNKTLFLYYDTDAFKQKMKGAIVRINSHEIRNLEDLRKEISSYSPGDEIKIETTEDNYTIKLVEDPKNKTKPLIGIVFYTPKKNFLMKVLSIMIPKKNSFVYYKAKSNPETTKFFYNLLWWLVVISFSLALINMLPVTFFDGGRIFYLTCFGLTKSEKISKKILKIVNVIILVYFIILTLIWLMRI